MFMTNVKRYLEIEGILNSFFLGLDYCLPHCIRQHVCGNAPSPGCCCGKYYKKYDLDHPAFELLRTQREKRYGGPWDFEYVKRISPCEYHTLNGCVLKTHKSPVCLSFMCRESIDFLRKRHGIRNYDYLGFYYALEWILTGVFSDAEFEAFKADCICMTEAINRESDL